MSLWTLPLEVETRLFTDPQFVASIQASLFLFQSRVPLVYARVKQLRGELDEAIEDYVRFRFAENAPLVNNKKQRDTQGSPGRVWMSTPPIIWRWPTWSETTSTRPS